MAHATFQGVRISLLAYPYPLLRPLVPGQLPADPRVRLASVEDIVAMKLSAIGSRGARRDFVDLYCAIQSRGWEVATVLDLFSEKFRGVAYDPYHFARALTYFANADQEAMPQMLSDVSWDGVKEFFEGRARALVLGNPRTP